MAEKALTAGIQEAYIQWISTRSVDDLVKAMGMSGVSKSQVSGQFSRPMFVASHRGFKLGTLTFGIDPSARGHGRWAMDIDEGPCSRGLWAMELQPSRVPWAFSNVSGARSLDHGPLKQGRAFRGWP